MKADTYSLATIFGRDVRYVVPLYQRPYVWNEEDHWEPLWQDIQWVLEHLNEGNGDRPTTHFLGAIVLEQQQTQVGEIDVRSVIDGQQRLATLQLFLAAASRVAGLRQQEAEANLLSGLTRNNQYLAKSRQERFKVWPTNVNREAFVAVMAPELVATHEDDPSNRVQEAYSYFFEALKVWSDEFADDASRTKANFAALTGVSRDLLKVVVIDLDPEDNAQAIFETLNARGTPLLAFDLVKNLVFDRADRAGVELDALYIEEWAEFDTPYWRAEIRQGRLKRARAELFLMHWLTMRRAEAVHAHHLYPVFKRLLDEKDSPAIVEVIREFARDGAIFKSFDEQPEASVARRFFDQLEVLDTTTALPIALLLFRSQVPGPERDAVFLMLESWLVRRMLCRLTASGYNRLFVDMLKELRKGDGSPAETIHSMLVRFDVHSSRWPTDAEVLQALTKEPIYGRIVLKRLVMLLSHLENDLRTALVEDVKLPANLSVEHVLPRSWKKHWPADGDPLAEDDREAHVNRLGNLTLVTNKLNPSLSNAAWERKRPALNKHSVLLLNRRLVDENPEIWDEARIDARSQMLAERALRIWPGPSTTLDGWRELAQSMTSAETVYG